MHSGEQNEDLIKSIGEKVAAPAPNNDDDNDMLVLIEEVAVVVVDARVQHRNAHAGTVQRQGGAGEDGGGVDERGGDALPLQPGRQQRFHLLPHG